MTREEAIHELLNAFKYNVDDLFLDACNMAIEALKADRPRGEWLLYDDWGNQTVTKDLIDNAPTIDAVPKVDIEHDREWIVGCIKHDGFIKTDRGDKANHIILEALKADTVEVVRCKDCKWYGHLGCAIRIVDDSDKPNDNDFCSFGERSE